MVSEESSFVGVGRVWDCWSAGSADEFVVMEVGVVAEVEFEDDDEEDGGSRTGRQARMRISRTRQSFPPL